MIKPRLPALSVFGKGLLLLCVFVGSLIYHLPASWVWPSTGVSERLPAQVTLNGFEGRIWNGQVYAALSGQSVGLLSWQVNPLCLLQLEACVDMRLDQANGGIEWQLNTGLLKQSKIEVSHLEGQVAMKDLQVFMPQKIQSLGEFKGTVNSQNLNFVWNQKQQWFESLAGAFTLNQLDVLGIQVPGLTVTPVLDKRWVELGLDGGAPGWRLTGSSRVSTREFEHDLQVKAESRESMPSWTNLFMRQKTPLLATLKQNGRW